MIIARKNKNTGKYEWLRLNDNNPMIITSLRTYYKTYKKVDGLFRLNRHIEKLDKTIEKTKFRKRHLNAVGIQYATSISKIPAVKKAFVFEDKKWNTYYFGLEEKTQLDLIIQFFKSNIAELKRQQEEFQTELDLLITNIKDKTK